MAKSLVPYLLSGERERERGVYFFSFFHNLFIQSLLLQLKNGRETMRYHVKKHKKKHISWNCFFHTLSCCSYSCSDQRKALFNRKAASAIFLFSHSFEGKWTLSLSLSLCGWWGRWKSVDFWIHFYHCTVGFFYFVNTVAEIIFLEWLLCWWVLIELLCWDMGFL